MCRSPAAPAGPQARSVRACPCWPAPSLLPSAFDALLLKNSCLLSPSAVAPSTLRIGGSVEGAAYRSDTLPPTLPP